MPRKVTKKNRIFINKSHNFSVMIQAYVNLINKMIKVRLNEIQRSLLWNIT